VATKQVVVDDLDGTEGAQTIRFALFDRDYEIDLTDQHASELENALAPYTGVARVVRHEAGLTRAGTRRRRRSAGDGSGPAPAEVRAWAEAHGINVPKRGRIPADVTAKFTEAQR
jgi:hypothetical protein